MDGKAKVDAEDENGVTPLHLAACKGHAEVARMLLEKKADVNAEDKYRRTPLHRAAKNGHVEVVGTLLDGGAKVDAEMRMAKRHYTWRHIKGMQRLLECYWKKKQMSTRKISMA